MIARVQGAGSHPGIVPIQMTYLGADPPCLQFEFVDGGDLAGLIRDWHANNASPDPMRRVARAIHRLAEIVAFAHARGIVHRDLKPANILVPQSDGEPTFRITDFGIGGIASKQARNATMKRTIAAQSQTAGLRGSDTVGEFRLSQLFLPLPFV